MLLACGLAHSEVNDTQVSATATVRF